MPPLTADSGEKPFRLDRERALIVVGFAVDQQDGLVDLVGVEERRNIGVDLGRLPEIANFVLKPERRERAVISAAAGDAGTEQIGVRQQIRRHERAVAVTADADAVAVGDAHFDGLVDRGLGCVDDLFDERVVLRFGRPNDRHRCVIKDRVSAQQQEQSARCRRSA